MEEVSVAKRIYRKRLVYWGLTLLFFILVLYTGHYAHRAYILGQWNYRWMRFTGPWTSFELSFCGFVSLVYMSIRLEKSIHRIYRSLLDVGETLYDLDNAEYIDSELGLLVYDGFLLSFKEEVNCVNLEECHVIYTDYVKERSYYIYYIQTELYSGETKKIKLHKTKDVKSRLNDLYAYIDEYYDISQTKNT